MSSNAPAGPKPPNNMGQIATSRVRSLLAGRLAKAGIATSRPEWYFQVEPGEAQRYPGGWQVRVRNWRHWSDARVHLNADTGEAMHVCVDRLAEPATHEELAEDEALRIAAGLMTIPRDARLAVFTHEEFAKGCKVAKLEWEHYIREFRIDGDYLWVLIHPRTHRLVAFGRKWRSVK